MNTNIVIISGRITRDLELKQSKLSNNKYCSNSIAVDMGKDQKGNKKTAFIPFTIWENNAEYLVKFAEKGSRVVLSGYLDQNKTFNHEKNCNEYELVFKPRQVEIIDWKKKEETKDVSNTEPFQDYKKEQEMINNFNNLSYSEPSEPDVFEQFGLQTTDEEFELPF